MARRPIKLYPWESDDVLGLFLQAAQQPEVADYPMRDPLVALAWIVKKQKDVLKDGTPWDVPKGFTEHERYKQAFAMCKEHGMYEGIKRAWQDTGGMA